MSTITVNDLDNLRHMLGVDERCRRGYRNYFVAGGDDVASMERLREAGFVIKNERYRLSSDPCYHATLEGARAIGLSALPK
jgi:cytosine/adenosine deaminase-related metal-dependent hydrolase